MGRRDTAVTQERVDELNRVRGWIQPVFTYTDPVSGEQHKLITEEDGERIAAGYACGDCGAIYEMVMPSCVVCREPIALQLAPMREEWTNHLADRERDGVGRGTAVSMDEFLAEVAADPDVEQRKL